MRQLQKVGKAHVLASYSRNDVLTILQWPGAVEPLVPGYKSLITPPLCDLSGIYALAHECYAPSYNNSLCIYTRVRKCYN